MRKIFSHMGFSKHEIQRQLAIKNAYTKRLVKNLMVRSNKESKDHKFTDIDKFLAHGYAELKKKYRN